MPSLCIKQFLCGLGLALLVGPFATARTVDAASAMSLAQAIRTAERDNKDLQVARQTVAIARARLQQAGQRPNPSLNFSENSAAAFGNSSDYVASVGISQAFPIAGRIARQEAVRRVDVALAMTEIEQNENNLASAVATAFYHLMVLDQQIKVRDRLLDATGTLVSTTRQRLHVAEAAELDVSAAQLEQERLIQESAQLRHQRLSQLAALNQLLGRPAAQALTPIDQIPDATKLVNMATQQQQALRRRPDLRSAVLSADRAHAEQALARAERWEDWTVGLSVEQSHQVLDGVAPQGTDRSLGISVSIPLALNNRSQGRLAESSATAAQATAHAEALRFSIVNEVASRSAEVERLHNALQNYQRTLLPLAVRTQKLTAQAYQQGQATIQNVVQAQQQDGELNSAYLDTLDQYLQAWVTLQAAVGTTVEHNDDGVAANVDSAH